MSYYIIRNSDGDCVGKYDHPDQPNVPDKYNVNKVSLSELKNTNVVEWWEQP